MLMLFIINAYKIYLINTYVLSCMLTYIPDLLYFFTCVLNYMHVHTCNLHALLTYLDKFKCYLCKCTLVSTPQDSNYTSVETHYSMNSIYLTKKCIYMYLY